jgi:hypothetical protein
MITTGLPTLSQIRAWDIDHLIEAAEHWDATADRWDHVYGQVWQQSLGMGWQGQARDALVERTTADKMTVTPKSDQLREAAQTARKGAGDISAVQRSTLYRVDDAHEAGFAVGEDLLANDTRISRNVAELAARQAQAQAFSADIRSRAAQLVATDSEVGANLTAIAGDVGSLTFDEKPITVDGKPFHVTADAQKGTIQLVGHGFKQDGLGPSPTPQPDPPAIKLPARTGPAPVQVITAAPPGDGQMPKPGFSGCSGEEQFKDFLAILGGLGTIGLSIPGETVTGGAATIGIIGGGTLVADGMIGLDECSK